jgi:uncharacterized protein (DUF3820 family)
VGVADVISVMEMPFGKYCGYLLDPIPRSYVQWALKNGENIVFEYPGLATAIHLSLRRDRVPSPAPSREERISELEPIVKSVVRARAYKGYRDHPGGSTEAMIAL